MADSVPGPAADIALVERSGRLGRLPSGVGARGDLASVGLDKLPPQGAAAPQQIGVEHTIGEVRRYQCLSQAVRHHRRHHTLRARAVAGLVNRRLRRVRGHREHLAA